MLELTKVSVERAHKLFQMLRRLDLLERSSSHDNVDEIYNAWRYAEKHELQKEQNTDSDTD